MAKTETEIDEIAGILRKSDDSWFRNRKAGDYNYEAHLRHTASFLAKNLKKNGGSHATHKNAFGTGHKK